MHTYIYILRLCLPRENIPCFVCLMEQLGSMIINSAMNTCIKINISVVRYYRGHIFCP